MVELRTIAATPRRIASNTSIGKPSGLLSDLIIIGGTAAMSTAFFTRRVPSRPVASDVPRDLAAAGRVSEERRLAKVKRVDHCAEIIGIVVHVVPEADLARAPVTSTVNRDTAVAVLHGEQHLTVPGVGV
jgi:hypothetical protein